MTRALFLAIGLVLLPALCPAQDDGGWWRQLFKPKQETASAPSDSDSMEDVQPAREIEGDAPSKDALQDPEEAALTSTEVDTAAEAPGGIRGRVLWDIPLEILALDSGRLDAKDIRIPGYRVQIFMGRLDSARSLKRSLEEEGSDEPIHVTPYPPLFGLTVGNVTTSLAAHRIREAWRPRFPNALVVPLDLPLDSVFPTAGTSVHGLDMSPTHRD